MSEMIKLPEAERRKIANYINANYVELMEFPVCCAAAEMAPCKDRSSKVQVRSMAVGRAPIAEEKTLSLEDMLRQEDAGFSQTLLKRIDETGRKDSEIYKRAGLTKQHFSKIRNNPNYKPTKATAIALAIALELDLEATRDLIGRAGYALTNSSKFDLIIRYFIEQGNYNIIEINMALYEFDQALLCS